MRMYLNINDENKVKMLWAYQRGLDVENTPEFQNAYIEDFDFARTADRIKRESIEEEDIYKISDFGCKEDVFGKDDKQSFSISNICKRYIENWPTMYEHGIGIMFYGPIGTGKTFFANAIVNEMKLYGVRCVSTSLSRIMNIIYSAKDKQNVIDYLNRYQLLVIDDFGVERDTQYSTETIMNIINTRSSVNKPLIITTNLSPKEMRECKNMQYSRIYSRLLSFCNTKIKLSGPDRRKEIECKKNEIAKMLLLDDL